MPLNGGYPIKKKILCKIRKKSQFHEGMFWPKTFKSDHIQEHKAF